MEEKQPLPDPLTETAQEYFGINYLFPYQRLVTANILEAAEYLCGRKTSSYGADPEDEQDPPAKQIVILPTGAGKSLCFMLPSLLLPGPTLVVFPLLSLISDQLRRCSEAGIGAAALTGGQSSTERRKIFSGIESGSIKIVLTNPETALSAGVLTRLRECRFVHLVFDEVHTISEWGDTFRPVCLESRRIYAEAEIPVVTAFTATASETVLSRVKEILFPGELPHIVSANPDRPNISYTVLPSLCKIGSIELLLGGNGDYGPAALVRRPVLIFCATRRKAERTALELRLRLRDNEIFFYHAGLDKEEKRKVEKWFHSSNDGILAATIAFGMGVDKPNVRTVIHRDISPSVEAYLQESGRAGRDRNPAEAILLVSPSDIPSPDAPPRFRALFDFTRDSTACRRETLMKLLGAAPDTCFGCDVCRKAVTDEAPWQEAILKMVAKNRRCLSRPEAVRLLTENFPRLTEADAGTMIGELIKDGRLKTYRFGPWKGMLTRGRFTAAYKSSES